MGRISLGMKKGGGGGGGGGGKSKGEKNSIHLSAARERGTVYYKKVSRGGKTILKFLGFGVRERKKLKPEFGQALSEKGR